MDADAVFKALADPTRRHVLDVLHARPGLTVGELCAGVAMRRQSLTQHVELLESVDLITSVRAGRRKLHYLNPVPIHDLQRRWIDKFEEPRLDVLDTIKRRAEEQTMPGQPATTIPDHVYRTYIRATPEQVWDALTDPELTARFWGHAQVSDWSVGSPVDHVRTDGSRVADATGTVIEVDRPWRLSFGFDDPAVTGEPDFAPSVVTFEIEPGDEIVRLTVIHSGFRTAQARRDAAQGWAAVVANLKTLLETGEPLPQAPWELDRAG